MKSIIFRTLIYLSIYAIFYILLNKPAIPSFSKLYDFLICHKEILSLLLAFYYTLRVWIIIFLCASLAGIIVGILLGINKKISTIISVDIDFWRSLPATVLVIFAMAIAGDNIITRTLPATYVTFFMVLFYTNKATCSIEKEKITHLKDLGANYFFILKDGYLPILLPSIMVSLRQALSLSLLILISAELIVGSSSNSGGVGLYLTNELYHIRYPGIVMSMLLTGIVGFLINYIGYQLNRKIIYWQDVKR